ncbi:MAG: aryl sulfotransferase, partial [Chloroflexi bacterium]|nr:aryl sulfotransferase [Chloroflexota bacterium]
SGHHPLPFSRVVEIDPSSNQIVWEYADNPAYNFFSPYISGARRLPNGNTLITEGMFGRMFQVTPEGDVVWEYINPHFHEDAENAVVNRVFRATHYLPEEISQLQ